MSYRYISASTSTVSELLSSNFESDSLLAPRFDSGLGGNMVVSPRTPHEMADLSEAGLSVWLYRIARDPELLNLPPRRTGFDTFEYRPLPLRLHYLMTPVVNDINNGGNDPGIEQLIIGKVLQTFHDNSTLSGSLLRGALIGTGSKLTVRLEPTTLEEITRVWDALESSYQLCISYEVSFVLLSSEKEEGLAVPVGIAEPEFGVIG